MRKARISVIMLFVVALFTVTTANATALLNPQSSIQPRYVGVNRAASDLTINSSGCANIYTFLSVMPNYTASVTSTLYSDSGNYIKSWSRSGGGNIDFQGSHYVASGHDYYVTLSATIYDRNGKAVDTVIKDSTVVSY